jgi:hypothetical protein
VADGEDHRSKAIEQRFAHEARHIDGSRAQEDAAAARLEEVDEIRIVAAQQEPQVAVQLAGAPLQCLQRFGGAVGRAPPATTRAPAA